MTFQYEVLIPRSNISVPSGYIWFLGSTMASFGAATLIQILNDLGKKGWEVVAVGNLGFDMGSEILLKKQIT